MMYDPHSPLKLPPLAPEAIEQSAELTKLIRQENHPEYPMGFDRFMNLALYHPQLGYYSSGRAMIGPQGDFITAPEISPLFGRCLGRQCAEVLDNLSGGDIVEVGAGSGVMAQQIMQELMALDRLPDRYIILEISPAMRKRQVRRLKLECAEVFDRFEWVSELPSKGYQGVMIANEVVDCLPMKRFRLEGGEVLELRVNTAGRGFAWQARPAEVEVAEEVEEAIYLLPHSLPEGYQSEIHWYLRAWIESMSKAMIRGMMLIIDYGYVRHEYYHPERKDGTLVCHYRHRAHDDPFLFVGLQDITAFVDFTYLAEIAEQQERMEVVGYTYQGAFLLNLGINEMLTRSGADARTQALLRAGVQRLVDPADMGERFKVIASARDYAEFGTPAGFRHMDMREKLAPLI